MAEVYLLNESNSRQPLAPLILFDIYEETYGEPVKIALSDEHSELRQRIVGNERFRVGHALEVARHLISICAAGEEFVRMDTLVPGNVKNRNIREHRKSVNDRLRSISEDFDGILEFQNLHRATEVRSVRPYGVAFTRRSSQAVTRHYKQW